MRESEERLRAIAEALPDLVFVVDEDGRYVELLASQENLLYLPAEKLRGHFFHEVFAKPSADRFLAIVRQTLATGKKQVLEYDLNVPAGHRWFEARTAVLSLPINRKRCVVFIAQDITDRKRAEELQNHNLYLQEELKSASNFGEMIGASEKMKEVFRNIAMVAATDATVLLSGETGTGKELVARAIHNLSPRKDRVLIKVNCGAIPAELVESELFGHEKGAFTGAALQKRGRFELAHQGTIFLDEVGELPLQTQVKLLRVLQEQEFERLGGTETIKVSTRVIAATNRDLEAAVKNGAFRTDLYYRLNIFPIHVPPLRERREDISLLASYFVKQFSARMGKHIDSIHLESLEKLKQWDWPGNVRELANILERAVILCQGKVLRKEHISVLGEMLATPDEFPSMEEMERRHILAALEKTGGVVSGPKGAAQLLNMHRSTLWARIGKLGIKTSNS